MYTINKPVKMEGPLGLEFNGFSKKSKRFYRLLCANIFKLGCIYISCTQKVLLSTEDKYSQTNTYKSPVSSLHPKFSFLQKISIANRTNTSLQFPVYSKSSPFYIRQLQSTNMSLQFYSRQVQSTDYSSTVDEYNLQCTFLQQTSLQSTVVYNLQSIVLQKTTIVYRVYNLQQSTTREGSQIFRVGG